MADTVYKLTHTGEQIDSAIDNAVRSDAQILTSEQQTQARTNIGAASAADLTTETNARITADTGVRGLTATVEATSTASQAYAIGAYFVYNGLLYKCTVAIAQGGTITPGTNCTATTAGAEISTLNQNLPRVLHGTTRLNVSPYIGHVTFATPMSNTDYVIILTPRYTSALTGGEPAYGPAVFNKTVNGFDYKIMAKKNFALNGYREYHAILNYQESV